MVGERNVEILVAGEKRQTANVVSVAIAEMDGEMGGGAFDGTRNNGRIWLDRRT